MNLPLHKDAQQGKKELTSHAGLWYDRFFNHYDKDWQVPKDEKGKLAWVNTVTNSPVGDEAALAQAVERQATICEAVSGEIRVLQSDWHFVTGMGNNHPVENGFAWHHTLGVPYLTGAAVKGMVRAWCEVWQDFDKDKIRHWFGGKGDEQAGELIFFDAIPAKPVQLKADIMTPHYGDWYAKGDAAPEANGSNVPADWHNPVPVPFLVVDKGQSFQFAVGKRIDSNINIEEVSKALTDALQWLGAGAKTAAGYGRFSEDEKAGIMRAKEMQAKQAQQKEAEARLKREEKAKASGLTGLALQISMFIQEKELMDDKSKWVLEGQSLIEQIKNHDHQQEQQAAAQLLMEICEKHDPGILANPDKTKGKKKRAVYKPIPIALAKALLALKAP